jgi:hypothetical protein
MNGQNFYMFFYTFFVLAVLLISSLVLKYSSEKSACENAWT